MNLTWKDIKRITELEYFLDENYAFGSTEQEEYYSAILDLFNGGDIKKYENRKDMEF